MAPASWSYVVHFNADLKLHGCHSGVCSSACRRTCSALPSDIVQTSRELVCHTHMRCECDREMHCMTRRVTHSEPGQLLCVCAAANTCTSSANVCVANVCVKQMPGDCLGCQCSAATGCTNFACLEIAADTSVCAVDSSTGAPSPGADGDFGGLGLAGLIGVAIGAVVCCVLVVVVVVVVLRKRWDTSLKYRDVEPVAVISSRLSSSTTTSRATFSSLPLPHQTQQHHHHQQQHHQQQQPTYTVGGQDLTPAGLPPPAYGADGRPRGSDSTSTMMTAQTGTINNFYGNITLSQRAW